MYVQIQYIGFSYLNSQVFIVGLNKILHLFLICDQNNLIKNSCRTMYKLVLEYFYGGHFNKQSKEMFEDNKEALIRTCKSKDI